MKPKIPAPGPSRAGGRLTSLIALVAIWAGPAPGAANLPPDAGKLPPLVARTLKAHGLSGKGLSVVVRPLDDGPALVSFNPSVPRNPASTIKLVTTLVGLDVLGPAYQWSTRAWLDGPLERGKLTGNLLLEGGGDPYMTVERFWTFVRNLRARGLTHIGGDLIIDADYFSVAAEDPGAFDGQPYRAYNVAPHALLVNFKAVRFTFFPSPDTKTVRVVPDPPLSNLVIDNRLSVVRGRCRGFQRGVSFHAPNGFAGDRVVFTGRLPAGCREYSLSRSVLDHQRFAYGVFRALWEQTGGTIDGNVRSGQAPQDDAEPFYIHRSAPLAEVIRAVNKYSNNVMTRHMLLTLGAERYGPPGSTPKGIDAVTQWLQEHAIGRSGMHIDNGAGLSRHTRIRADTMAALLAHGAAHPFAAEFVASMPVAGLDGTLSRRFRAAPLSGKMHLKTGRLDHVVALAGFVRARSGKRYAVVSLHNADDVHRGTGKDVQDALLNWVYDQ